MNLLRTFFSFLSIACVLSVYAQEEEGHGISIGITGGISSYQGDLQPTSFSFQQSDVYAGAWLRYPLVKKFSVKAGFLTGRLHAADASNRDYLKVRNLSFYTRINEVNLLLDYELFDFKRKRFTPFGYGGIAYFHFNPYTFDGSGQKVHLQPLGTEGQGLSRYPDRKVYKLSQVALVFGGGFRYLLYDAITISLETGERKTFTDYLDDVSTSYADAGALQAARGAKAVELAFRGDELPNGALYPNEGEQRGTPTKKDWYYFAGVSVEMRLKALASLLSGNGLLGRNGNQMRCPRVN
jgi:hypothetical protein